MKKNESMEAVGEVSIQGFKIVDGEKVYLEPFDKNNLVVEEGRSVVVDLILGLTQKKLTFIEWGRGGAPSYPDGDPLEEYEVEDKDTELAEVIIRKKLHDVKRLSPTKIQYVETLISDEVDSPVNEAALVFLDHETLEESIFARITFPTVSLLEKRGFGIELTWTINFREVQYRNEERRDHYETRSID